jgi:hypothetical protein
MPKEKESIVVSDRSQITLPSALHKPPGLRGSSAPTAEKVSGKIAPTPATVIETESYSAEQIAEWNRADTLRQSQRRRLLDKLRNKPRA